MRIHPMDLIADIGGTHARFALTHGDSPWSVEVFKRRDYPSLEAAIKAYLARHGTPPLENMLIAWAAMIGGDTTQLLQHNNWKFARAALIARFGLKRLHLINDTQAVALSLPALGAADLHPLNKVRAAPDGARLVLGIGTGFGNALSVRAGEGWIALPGEAGHALVSMNHEPRANAILHYLQNVLGVVTVTNVVSGPGLRNLYSAIQQVGGGAAEIGQTVPDAEVISAAALAGSDPAAVEAMRLLIQLLAQACYNLGVSLLATGGIYLAGGLGCALLPFADDDYLTRHFGELPFPVSIITRENPAFLGLKQLL